MRQLSQKMQPIIKRRKLKTDFNDKRYHSLVQRIYAARGICDGEQLRYTLDRLPDPNLLQDMRKAVDLLAWALREKAHITIIGDFDADGATSSALAVRGLTAMGATAVDYLVPNRFEFGYGLTPEIVALAKLRKPDLIVTVDNGIASLAGVSAAKQAGIKVIITDHHLPGATLPAADAIINPNRADDCFPSKCIAGVGVMFCVLMALRSHLRQQGWFSTAIPEPNLAQWLDLVALGTVADVVPLDHCNRIFVAQGLARISRNQMAPGIRALLEQGNRVKNSICASDLSFAVAPRLNAAGRLQDMSVGIECLLTDDPVQARRLAEKLDQLNRERRQIEAGMAEGAFAMVEKALLQTTPMPSGLCLFEHDWHQGVVGIVASRVKERCHRPVIAFASVADNEMKGSGRSIPGVHLRDVLDSIANKHPGLLSKFGGHAMAVGLSLEKHQFETFRNAFETEIQQRVQPHQLQRVVLSDGALHTNELNMEMVKILQLAGPWGQNFPEPVFDGWFEVRNRRVLKDLHLKMALRVPESNYSVDAIAFNYLQGLDATHLPEEGERVHIAYRIDINEYMQQQRLQLRIEAIEPMA